MRGAGWWIAALLTGMVFWAGVLIIGHHFITKYW